MTQYDAGPGEWSDRPWEDPNRKPTPQAKRRRVTLPPWALLVIMVGLVILLCVSLVLIVKAIRRGREAETPTPIATTSIGVSPTFTPRPTASTPVITPTNTVTLPLGGLETPTPFTEIITGATVTVQGTAGAGLNLREQPTTYAKVVGNVKESAALTVLAGPRDSDGYVWWKLRSSDGKEGWGAANWLALKTD